MNGNMFLRLSTGLLFLVVGGKKLMSPDFVVNMITNLGFPAPVFFAWLLIIAEVVCGLMLVANFKAKLATYPLMAILVVAIIMVKLKMGISQALVDLVIFSSLLAINLGK